MKLHHAIKHRAPRNGYICDAATDKKAKTEAAEYTWQVISPGFYLCQHGKNGYVIEESVNSVGCACEAMTFNKNPGEVCKHIVAMSFLDEVPREPVSEDIRKMLRWEGWIGEIILLPPSSYQQKKKLPHVHDPDRQPGAKAEERKVKHLKYDGMNMEQMLASMDDAEIEKNARKGGVAAIAELARRMAAREAGA
jgi:hypothetical protein